jgi:hypothetical protein
LTVFSKCIITDGCRGKLYKISRNPDNLRETVPPFVSSLEDYSQRLNFFQTEIKSPSSEWTVEHNLNCFPSITIYDLNQEGVYTQLKTSNYNVQIIDNNTLKIIFLTARRGKIHCLSRSSTEKFVDRVQAQENLFKITNNGIFTFAIPKFLTKLNFVDYTIQEWQTGVSYTLSKVITYQGKRYSCQKQHTSDLNNSPPSTEFWFEMPSLPYDLKNAEIRLEVIIQKPNDQPIICLETLFPKNQGSPWSDWDEILLNKRKSYYIRTKSILDFDTFDNAELKFDDIPEGTTIKFTRIDYGTGVLEPLQQKGLILLLSKSPYSFIDKIKDKIIDLGEIVLNDVDFLVYKNSDIYSSESIIENVYPEIVKS